MHRKIRSGIFLVFLTIFVIGAPVIVFYTAGYRVNFNTWRVQRTGVIAITTLPRGASVTIDNELVADKTPYVVQRLTPGDYDVLLQKVGYKAWNQRVTVSSGETTYLTALLFSEIKPELLLEESAVSVVGDTSGRYIYLLVADANAEGSTQSIWRYDTITRLQKKLTDTVKSTIVTLALNSDESALILQSDSAHNPIETIGIDTNTGETLSAIGLSRALNAIPEYSLFDNGSNVEMRLISTNALIALLPSSTYTTIFRENGFAVLTDSRNRAYLLNLSTQTISQIDLPTALLSGSSTERLLAASDGNEIDVYNPQTGERTFISRQSEPIIALSWHSSERALLFATASKILAIERDKEETRETTPIVEEASIINMWPDTNGKSITFFGTVHGITGIWKVALTQ